MKRIFGNKSRGFTLIELLIVIAIIGLLASVIMVSVSGARAKARDARRLAEITQVSRALESYYSDKGYYPDCDSNCDNKTVADNFTVLLTFLRTNKYISWQEDAPEDRFNFFSLASKAFAAAMNVQDPLNDATHKYSYKPGWPWNPGFDHYQNYRLRVNMETRSAASGSRSKGHFIENGDKGCNIDEATGFYPYCVGSIDPNYRPAKPVIYLYPEKETAVKVNIYPKEVTNSIPQYNNGWDVVAQPSGLLRNLSDGQEYPYLFLGWPFRQTWG